MLLPALSRAKEKGVTIYCVNNLHQLGLAMQMYGDDYNDRLPVSYADITVPGQGAWNGNPQMPWTEALASYYGNNTNVLRCPALNSFYNHSGYSYFMGSDGFANEDSSTTVAQPTSVILRSIAYPSMYILSGDCNFPSFAINADLNDNDLGTNCSFSLVSPIHIHRVNILFADFHVRGYARFTPSEMTYSPSNPNEDWTGTQY